MAPLARSGRRWVGRATAVALGLSAATGVQAAAPGLAVGAPTMRSSAVIGQRIALLIVPQPSATSGRVAAAHADEEAYRKRLRDLGFEVWTLGPADRPQLDRGLRDAAGRIPENAQVAIFALGTSAGGKDDVYLLPQDAPSDAGQRPDLLDSEGIRLSDALRRVALRRPRVLVAVIDECQPATGGQCDFGAAAGGSGASLIGGERLGRRGGAGTPLAGRTSLRDPMLAAMAQEGETFLQSYETLKRGLAGSDLEARASDTLTTSFAFVPQGLFAGLPTECNRIEPNAEPAAVRGATLDTAIRGCEAMAATYPYARYFEDRLQAGREQRAYQKAVASCSDPASTAGYNASYPAGRFRALVESFELECGRERDRRADQERQRDAERRQREQDEQRRAEEERLRREQERDEQRRQEQRTTVASTTGWTLSYSTNLLDIAPAAKDVYDPQKQTYTTVWHSRQHGDQVAIFLQVSPNERTPRNTLPCGAVS